MTEATATAVSQALLSVFSAEDPLIDFSVPEWFAPPLFVPHNQETPAEARIRQNNEKDYRATTTRSQWHRYLTLGRYALSGPDFDAAMEDYASDPIKVHCLIWYNFHYHVDRYMESPPKLEAWATKFSQPYLEKHRESALLLDTTTTKWTVYAKQQSLTESWSQVTSKHRPSNKQHPKSFQTPALLGARKKPTTITEENSKESSSAQSSSGGEPPTQIDEESNSSVGKMSTIIPNLNVPVCDGTHRVTIRWKMPVEISRISRQAAELKEAIYKLLHELFRDEDGHLYNWTDDGKESYNAISKMTSSEVRQFICPSLTISPSQSMAIIPLRFGFSDTTPSKWRNSEATKSTLEKHNATVSISNSTSTSGNLVISGYILTKAPMTTHRLRYLQSLRKQLPDTTPPFDILLHKRSPTDLLILHLVVQCGEKHVHALSEALMSILKGGSSAVFIPRSAFEQMSKDEAVVLFQTHDTYVKALQWISLSPLLSNLDRPRTEHCPDGSKIERTTREWARSIMNGSASAKCDVVNGGTDQKAYLLFPPESGDAVYIALQEYRQSLYPFTQREARYREQVGPATSVQFSTKVIANLEFMKKLSTDMSGKSVASATEQNSQSGQSTETAPSKAAPSNSTTSSVSEVSQATMPPTSAESLRQQYRVHDQGQDASTVDTEHSDSSRSTSPSKLSSSRMSTTSAKLREIDVFLHQQKEAREKNEQLASDRISQMERHLYRIQDAVKQDVSTRLTAFEDRLLESMKTQVQTSGDAMDSMNAKLEKLMSVVEKVITGDIPQALPHSGAASRQLITAADDESSCTSHSQNTVRSRILTQTRLTTLPITVKSPDKKRLKSTGKRKLKEPIRRHLELYKSKAKQVSTTSETMDTDLETPKASPSDSAAEDDVEMQQHGNPREDLTDITTDLERRYTASEKDAPNNSSGRGLQK